MTVRRKQSELKAEQEYFDRAQAFREESRSRLRAAPAAAIHKGAAAALRAQVREDLDRLRAPDEAVAFGRFDTEAHEKTYVGYNAIWNGEKDILVVGWQAPVAAPYFSANHENRLGLRARRSYECHGNRIVDFDEVLFEDLAADVARLEDRRLDDALLTELSRERTGEMQDIVRTIQAAQYEIIRSDFRQCLLVQGGAGTGKTAVGLHRISWLLYNLRDELKPKDVLVVGPNRTFVRYIRRLLPSLGDNDVTHAEYEGLLATPVRLGREETADLVRLKGELRMAELLGRGIRGRVSVPDGPLQLRRRGRLVKLDRSRLERFVQTLQSLPYATGRQRLRDYLRLAVSDQTDKPPSPDDDSESLLERIWPQMTAASLQELLGSETRLITAAGELFSAAEVRNLYRKASDRLSSELWSPADVPLLDHSDFLIRGAPPSTFKHLVVDEAQDLSPMQIRMLARRSENGSMTILGDLAQSTGPWGRDSWEEVTEQIKGRAPVHKVELEFGYRVPRQIFEVAATVLASAAPAITPPRVVRDGPSDPTFLAVSPEDRATSAVERAQHYAASGRLVAIICSDLTRPALVERLNERDVNWSDAKDGSLGRSITLLSASESKGLEFDSVVIVEPEEIAIEDRFGLRLLYVALTRATRELTVVHSGSQLPVLPTIQPQAGEAITKVDEPPVDAGRRRELPPLVHAVAQSVAQQILDLVQPDQVEALLNELIVQLKKSHKGET